MDEEPDNNEDSDEDDGLNDGNELDDSSSDDDADFLSKIALKVSQHCVLQVVYNNCCDDYIFTSSLHYILQHLT